MEGTGIHLPSQPAPIAALITEQLKTNSTVQKQSLGFGIGGDTVRVGMDNIYKNLTVLADQIVSKLNEILKDDLPDGLASLNPADHTSEKTAQRIVDGATALLPVFAKQNPDLEGEELITQFMETIRGGIDTGYNQAAAILGDLGAFKLDGIQSGIEETMRLVEEQLVAFEEGYRSRNGLPSLNGEEAQPVPNDPVQNDAVLPETFSIQAAA